MIYKESYQRIQLIITEFDNEDIITTSAQTQQPTEWHGDGIPVLGPGGSSNTPGAW